MAEVYIVISVTVTEITKAGDRIQNTGDRRLLIGEAET
jgi:hypothetical protein